MSQSSDDPTIGRLVANITRDLSSIIEYQIALAKSELRVSVRAGGLGTVLLVVAGLLAFLALILLPITVAYFIVMAGLHPAWAFLIVMVGLLLLAGLIAWIGVRRFKKVTVPEKTIAAAKQIPTALKPGADLHPGSAVPTTVSDARRG